MALARRGTGPAWHWHRMHKHACDGWPLHGSSKARAFARWHWRTQTNKPTDAEYVRGGNRWVGHGTGPALAVAHTNKQTNRRRVRELRREPLARAWHWPGTGSGAHKQTNQPSAKEGTAGWVWLGSAHGAAQPDAAYRGVSHWRGTGPALARHWPGGTRVVPSGSAGAAVRTDSGCTGVLCGGTVWGYCAGVLSAGVLCGGTAKGTLGYSLRGYCVGVLSWGTM
jgi:hypothetical protein